MYNAKKFNMSENEYVGKLVAEAEYKRKQKKQLKLAKKNNHLKINEDKLLPIDEVVRLYATDLPLEKYGNYIAKIEPILNQPNPQKKLVLISAISPTKAGEGKTTVAIGLNDALNMYGNRSIVTLREPSIGPLFGRKGGATGGGRSKVLPEDKINLHFTGDLHAIATANNLVAAIIDNEIY